MKFHDDDDHFDPFDDSEDSYDFEDDEEGNEDEDEDEDNDDDDEEDIWSDVAGLDMSEIEDLVKYIVEKTSETLLGLDNIRSVLPPGVYAVESMFDTGRREKVRGLTRIILSTPFRGGFTLGTTLVQALARELEPYENKLLFGLIDGVYLHATRSFTFDGSAIMAGVRVVWDTQPNGYKLILYDVTSISTNKEFVYLVVGDLLEELLNGIEEETDGRDDRDIENTRDDIGNDVKGKQDQS